MPIPKESCGTCWVSSRVPASNLSAPLLQLIAALVGVILMTCSGCGAAATVGGSTYCAKCLLMATDADADEPLLAGADDCPPCELLSLMGETSRAVTFLGEQTWPVHRLVAFKLFKADAYCPLTHLERTVSAPRSPIVTSVAESGRIGGRPYAVTPYLAGGSLPQCYDRHRIGLAARTMALIAIAEAVAQAHAHGIGHGHLVPANVLCEPRAPFGVHIVDFECNAGKSGGATRDALMQDDLVRLIELAELVLQGTFAEEAEMNRVRQRLRLVARSAEDVRGALEELQARLGA